MIPLPPTALHQIGRHRLDYHAAPGPDALSSATCTDAGIHSGCIYECPVHSPSQYAMHEAKHRAKCEHPLHLARRHPVTDRCLFLRPVRMVGAR